MGPAAPIWTQTLFGSALVSPEYQHSPPRKKFRNAKRYYRALESRVAAFEIPEAAYYFWHKHIDRDGDGDRSWKDRQRHLALLFTLLCRIEQITRGWKTPHQVWLQLYPAGSWEDCIWVHTAGSGEPFPYDFRSVDWLVRPPERLQQFFSDRLHEFGRSDCGRTIFYVRASSGA